MVFNFVVNVAASFDKIFHSLVSGKVSDKVRNKACRSLSCRVPDSLRSTVAASRDSRELVYGQVPSAAACAAPHFHFAGAVTACSLTHYKNTAGSRITDNQDARALNPGGVAGSVESSRVLNTFNRQSVNILLASKL